ncbi:MurR/RpiR family transcriptional regulator [Bacillus safensis]|uniref:MurR/RpiR family transcriptional regulator n=1 Tax=Bacillus TaxID=1386 RepID=UPI001C0DA9E3|nr:MULTISPECIES: MurR/RpiR family transcriptional regulator [Bacillus]MCR6471101.1 MurR/RpiR family transcriptional regulator [Bacillus safensis]MEC1414228.1 MurR/RpiR family transcriptional regulator [Bacillus safensis]QWS50307.1 MurR/RpiR family transcriptional regulator [Bacillus sp. JNUCC-24]UPI91724.1 MurR/RpiR family transcriptional regulator [Bacillus safensis]WHX75112.1 MurR/RpiR family transcriptional regulator [Bacillus safensis]
MDDFIHKLQHKVAGLTEAQRRIADYIVHNPMEVAFLTVDKLASKVGTSTATIMRFSAAVGYSGFSELQKELQSNMKHKAAPQTRLEANLKHSNKSKLLHNHVELQFQNIQYALDNITEETFQHIVEKIASSRQVLCTSVRSGRPVGEYLSQGINRLLGNCQYIDADKSDWVDELVHFQSDDFIIAVSYPRYAKRIKDLLEAAKSYGVEVLLITDSYSSPLTKYAQYVLPCSSASAGSHNSVVSAIFIVDYILSALAINDPERTKPRLDQINHMLTKMSYHTTH